MMYLLLERDIYGKICRQWVEEEDKFMVPIWCNHDHNDGYDLIPILTAKEKVDRGLIA